MPLNLVQTCDKKLLLFMFSSLCFLVSILQLFKKLPLVIWDRKWISAFLLVCCLRKCLRLKHFFSSLIYRGGEKGFEKLLRGKTENCFRLIKHYVKLDFYHAKLNLAMYTTTFPPLSTPYASFWAGELTSESLSSSILAPAHILIMIIDSVHECDEKPSEFRFFFFL